VAIPEGTYPLYAIHGLTCLSTIDYLLFSLLARKLKQARLSQSPIQALQRFNNGKVVKEISADDIYSCISREIAVVGICA
jgi:hypothetical protein